MQLKRFILNIFKVKYIFKITLSTNYIYKIFFSQKEQHYISFLFSMISKLSSKMNK